MSSKRRSISLISCMKSVSFFFGLVPLRLCFYFFLFCFLYILLISKLRNPWFYVFVKIIQGLEVFIMVFHLGNSLFVNL